MSNLMQNKLNVIVYNFVDMLSHARTEMEIIRELADDEKAYRSITLSWFEHSPLLVEPLLQFLSGPFQLLRRSKLRTSFHSTRLHHTFIMSHQQVAFNLLKGI